MYNRSYGKLEDPKTLKFAPAGVDDSELLADGWLPVDDNAAPDDDGEYEYVAVGFKEVEGHIEKDYVRRRRTKKYSKAKIIELLGDGCERFADAISKYPELLDAFSGSTVFLEDCDALRRCVDIYSGLTGMTSARIAEEILAPAEMQGLRRPGE